jgi:hypothetical protein
VNAAPSNFPPPFQPLGSSAIHPVFPRIWLGFLLSAFVLFLELSTGVLVGWQKITRHSPVADSSLLMLAAIVLYLAGLIYWYRWIYHIHKILAQVTESKYPISPRKAVGYQFIPFYNLVWNFKWTNRIADFVRQHSTVHMHKGWIGLWLLFASVLGLMDKGLELVLLFTISAYLTRKIRRSIDAQRWAAIHMTFAAAPAAVDPSEYAGAQLDSFVPPPEVHPAAATPISKHLLTTEAPHLRMSKEWRLAVGSGIGAAFGFLMCYGLWFLLSAIEQKGAMLRGLATEGVSILLVATVLYFFLEPLADRVFQSFLSEEHHAPKKPWQKLFRFGVFVLIVDVAHLLLERAADEGGGFHVARLGILLTLFFGGMTYLWIWGSPKPLRVAMAQVGACTAGLLIFGVFVVQEAKHVDDRFTELSMAATSPSLGQRLEDLKTAATAPPGAQEVGQAIANAQTGTREATDVALVLACAVFVAVWGFVAMHRKLRRVGVAATVFTASLLSAVGLGEIPHSTLEKFFIVISLWSAFWWCLGMLAFYDHDIFQPPQPLSGDPHPESGHHDPLPRSAWGVCFVIFAGLVVAAIHFRPHGKEIAAPTLTVAADDKERPYGAANPALTFSVTGLESGDTTETMLSGDPSLCSAAAVDSPPGLYPIAVGPGTGDTKEEKYRLHFVPGSLKVVQASTHTNLASSASTTTIVSPVTFTAVVAPQAGGTPSGTITFYADAHPLGTGALSSGRTSYTASGLPAGTHLITAEYSGDTNFSGSTSDQWTQQSTLPEVRPHAPTMNAIPAMSVIPAGTAVMIATTQPIDSSTSKPNVPLVATLAAPIVVDGRVLEPKGSMAILGVTDIDPVGILTGKPAMTIHLARIEIAGKNYQQLSTIRMQGSAPGRIYIAPASILTFRLQSPLTTDVPIPVSASNRRAAR